MQRSSCKGALMASPVAIPAIALSRSFRQSFTNDMKSMAASSLTSAKNSPSNDAACHLNSGTLGRARNDSNKSVANRRTMEEIETHDVSPRKSIFDNAGHTKCKLMLSWLQILFDREPSSRQRLVGTIADKSFKSDGPPRYPI